MNIYFTYESRDTLKSFTLIIAVKAITKMNLGHHNKFEIEFQKLSRKTQNWLFTLLFCRGRQRNVQRVLLYLPTQIDFPIGGEPVTCRGLKLTNSRGRTKLATVTP